MSHRIGDTSPQLRALFRTFVELYTEWSWPLPKGLLGQLTPGEEVCGKTVSDFPSGRQLRGLPASLRVGTTR
jgi:hypothetical protein